MPTSSTACLPCRLEWRPHPWARATRFLLIIAALVAVAIAKVPFGISLLLGWVLAVFAVVVLIERYPTAWVMRVDLRTGHYTRQFADGAMDEGEVVGVDAVFPLFRLQLRPAGARFGQDCVFIPDTWWHSTTRPWRLLVRAYRPTKVESLLNPGA